MTRKEAIQVLRDWDGYFIGHSSDDVNGALNMAIKALEQEPCDDAISRQAVLDLVADYDLSMGQVVKAIHALPSVTPQPRTGRWIQKEEEGDAEPFIIWECSECHCVDEDGKPSYKYCPQCGARMEVEE